MAGRSSTLIQKAAGLFALLLVIGAVAFPSSAYAISRSDLTAANGWTCHNVNGNANHIACTNTDGSTAQCDTYAGDTVATASTVCSQSNPDGTSQQSNNSAGTTITATTDANGQSNLSIDNPAAEVLAKGGVAAVLAPVALISYLILSICGWLVGIASLIFNLAVTYLVFGFSTFVGNSPGMLAAWRILRDFGNIVLIFGFVLSGIQTILDVGHFNVGKALARLVIFAVLLNFSLFAAEAVIDATNVIASQVYEHSFGTNCPEGSAATCGTDKGVAGSVLAGLGVTSILQFNSEQATAISNVSNIGDYFSNPIGVTIEYLGLALLLATAAVVFLAGAFMLISRGVVLGFIMVTSPVGFAGMAVPQLESIARDWWDKLIKQALFAPVFILLILVSLKLVEGLNAIGGGKGLADAIKVGTSLDAGPILLFFMVLGFMVGALMIANRFGIYGADMAIKTAAGAVYGTVGAIGRNTLGRGSAAIANRINLSPNGSNTWLGRRALDLANYGASASYSGRGVVGAATKAVAKVDLGKVGKDAQKGFRGETEANNKRVAEYAKARTAAWKAQDGEFNQQGKDLQIEEDQLRSRAAIARRAGNAEQANALDTQAAQVQQQRERVPIDKALAQRQRLTTEERQIRGYQLRSGRAAERAEEDAAGNLDRAARALTTAAEGLTAANQRVTDLRVEAASGTGRNAAEIESDMRFAAAEQERAEMEHETAVMNRDTARSARQAATADRVRRNQRSDAYNAEVKNPEYAVEQIAQSLSRIAASAPRVPLPGGASIPVGVDVGRLRAAAASIRGTKGHSDIDRLLHELGHKIEHANHAADHAGDHGGGGGAAPAPAGGGGGGGHGPAH